MGSYCNQNKTTGGHVLVCFSLNFFHEYCVLSSFHILLAFLLLYCICSRKCVWVNFMDEFQFTKMFSAQCMGLCVLEHWVFTIDNVAVKNVNDSNKGPVRRKQLVVVLLLVLCGRPTCSSAIYDVLTVSVQYLWHNALTGRGLHTCTVHPLYVYERESAHWEESSVLIAVL